MVFIVNMPSTNVEVTYVSFPLPQKLQSKVTKREV